MRGVISVPPALRAPMGRITEHRSSSCCTPESVLCLTLLRWDRYIQGEVSMFLDY